MQTLAEAASGEAGSSGDEKIQPIYVGSEEITGLIKEAFTQKQYGSKHVDFYATVDEALLRARALAAGVGA